LTDAALQSVNRDHDGRPIKHLDKAVEEAFVIMGSWLEVFFQNAPRIPDSQPILGRSWVETPRNVS
jgi:hypothetical protein